MRTLALSIIICLVFVGHLCIGQDEETFEFDILSGQWVLHGIKAIARGKAGEKLSEKERMLGLSVIFYIEGFFSGVIFAPTLDPHHLCIEGEETSLQILGILEEHIEELLKGRSEKDLPPVRALLVGALLQREYRDGMFCFQ